MLFKLKLDKRNKIGVLLIIILILIIIFMMYNKYKKVEGLENVDNEKKKIKPIFNTIEIVKVDEIKKLIDYEVDKNKIKLYNAIIEFKKSEAKKDESTANKKDKKDDKDIGNTITESTSISNVE